MEILPKGINSADMQEHEWEIGGSETLLETLL